MDWRIKAGLYRLLSAVDRRRTVHRLIQRRLTRRLKPLTDLKDYREHRAALIRHSGTLDATLYEFGAGWHLSSQVAMWCYGVQRQTALDIERLMRPGLLDETLKAFAALHDPDFVRRPEPGMTLADMGVEDRAPADARITGLAANSIDFVISTNTLEHIPVEDILAIMIECHRLCHESSVLSIAIDYSDHYGHRGGSVSRVNFLRFSDEEWRAYQSRLLWQNRLRHPDYRPLFERAGFAVLEESFEVRPEDIEALERLPLAGRFRGYKPEHLAACYGRYVLRPGKRDTESGVWRHGCGV